MNAFLSLIVLNSTIGTCHGLTAGHEGEPAARNQEVVDAMEGMIASLRSEFNSTLEQKLTQQQQEFEDKLLQQNASFEQKSLQQREEFEQSLAALALQNRARIDTLENIVTQIIQASAPGRDQPIPILRKILLNVNESGPAGDELISMLSRNAFFDDQYTPASKLYVLFYALFYHTDPQVALTLLQKFDSRAMNEAIEKDREDVAEAWEDLMDRLDEHSELIGHCNVDVWRVFLEKIDPRRLRISGSHGLTALHIFVRDGPASIVQLLLDYMRPEDIFRPNHANDSAFHAAARASVTVAEVFASHPKTEAEHFLDRSNTHEYYPRGSTPLMLSLEFDNIANAKVLLKWQIRKNVPPPFVKLRATCKLLRHALSLNANDTPSENDLCGALVSFEGKPELLRKIGNFLWRDQDFRSLTRSLADTKKSVFQVLYREEAELTVDLQQKMLKQGSAEGFFTEKKAMEDIISFREMLENPAKYY